MVVERIRVTFSKPRDPGRREAGGRFENGFLDNKWHKKNWGYIKQSAATLAMFTDKPILFFGWIKASIWLLNEVSMTITMLI